MEIHHCIHCGTEAQSTWRFCRRCGTGLADLEQIERVAQCGNCATELAEVWRFCPNCGTSSDTATPRTGLSNDDVADLIAAPEGESTGFVTPTGDFDAIGFGDEAATIQDGPPAYPEPAFEEPQAAPIEPAAVIEPEVEAPPPTPIEPAALLEPEVETPPPAPIEPAALIEPEIADPLISKPSVAFEPEIPDYAEPSTADLVAEDPAPPLRGLDLSAEAPAPPLDPMATVAEIEARLAADRPPPPGDDFDDIAAPEIADDGPLPRDWDSSGEAVLEAKESTAVFEVHRESAADIATDSGLDEKPAVVIPPSRTADRPDIPTELPTPLGSPQKPSTEIPQPIEQQAKSSWSPTPPKAVEKPAGELPPTDRLFQDPGLLGQATQLALLVAAAVSVAMVVAHIVLNNRLTDYQETFESIPRVESVQSIIGTWLRYLLILTLLGAFVLTVAWARRVVANLAIFRKPVSEAALWMWAIPLVNILVVRQHFDNAWKGSDVLLKDDPEWKKSRGNWWTLGFTALALLTVAVLFYGSNFVNADNIEGSLDSNSYLMIGYALLAASLLCLVRSISGIMERQHNRARQFV